MNTEETVLENPVPAPKTTTEALPTEHVYHDARIHEALRRQFNECGERESCRLQS